MKNIVCELCQTSIWAEDIEKAFLEHLNTHSREEVLLLKNIVIIQGMLNRFPEALQKYNTALYEDFHKKKRERGNRNE
jgi:hypothetical protein